MILTRVFFTITFVVYFLIGRTQLLRLNSVTKFILYEFDSEKQIVYHSIFTD